MRRLVSLSAAALVAASSVALAAAPAQAHGNKEDRERMRLEGLSQVDGTPVLSDNLEHQGNVPGQVGIAGCFMQTDQIFVTSGLESVRVYDVTDATAPTEVGVLEQAVFENEAMNCGERVIDGKIRRFALIGVDLHQASPDDPDHVNTGDGQEIVMVEVTDPTNPTIVGRGPATTSTHTVTCVVDSNCRYAYTAGDSGDEGKPGHFTIFDLRNPEKPREVDANPRKEGVQPFRSPTAAHKWNFTSAQMGIHTGFGGTSIWDVSSPRKPKLMITTGKAGRGEGAGEGFNDFIHHNANWANADGFKANAEPSTENGNLLLVTEEDYVERDCSIAGSFQTWWIKRLENRKGPEIVPLDKVEITDLQADQPSSVPTPVSSSFCSAHWFDRRAGDLVAVGYYGGGTQFVDTSNPRDITSYAYAYWGGSQVWDTRFVPLYRDGKQVQRKSNVAYSIDLVRGLDVYTVDLGDGRGTEPTPGVRPETTAIDRASTAVLPVGLVALALGLVVAVRRRSREA